MSFKEYKNEVVDWCKEKNWVWRLFFLIWFGYVLIRHISDPMYRSILAPLNLGLHEFGHLIFIPLGNFMHMVGGTIFQIFVPIFAVFNFYRQSDYFALGLSFGWLSTSLFDVSCCKLKVVSFGF